MAWSDPGDFTSGQILTAAQMDSIREAMFFGQATFTNEAARDAAIPPVSGVTLQEGMRAYLTASTVATATGGTTFIPSGITTTYNGTSWVCTSPVGSYTGASQTRANAAYGDLATVGPSVTLATGTTALVSIKCYMQNSAAAGSGAAGVAVAVSGATTLAASDGNGLLYLSAGANFYAQWGATFVIGGLTAGTNTFTLKYRSAGADTATFQDRFITVQSIA